MFISIAKLPSKSTVPDPSESISSIIMSNSSFVNWSSNSLKISFKHVVGMYPLPAKKFYGESTEDIKIFIHKFVGR